LRGWGNIRGAYLVAIIASILVIGGFSPAIGILWGEELRGEGALKGKTGDEILSGMGNNRGFRDKGNKLKPVDASVCAEATTVTRGGVVNLGVGKSSMVLGIHHGTPLGERGVTRISPSNPRPGGENSIGTVPKFRKRETSEKGLLRNWGWENGVPTEGDGRLPSSAAKASPS
jgi:hypothetical protein